MTILVNQNLAEDNHTSDQQNGVNNSRSNHRINGLNTENQNDFPGVSREKHNHVYADNLRNLRVSGKPKAKLNKRDHHRIDKNKGNSNGLNGSNLTGGSNKHFSCQRDTSGVNSPVSLAPTINTNNNSDEKISGYNSGDEHQREEMLTPEEWDKRDANFAKAIADRGLVLSKIDEDGACLFRAIALQIYGDQDMHDVIRQQTMDYIQQNREHYAQFVTEDIHKYISRKRLNNVHGNHIEIQAISEIFNRAVELYNYDTQPANIFNPEQLNNGNEPLRLSYQRCSHYNAILNPYKSSVGVGLGLAGYHLPEEPEQNSIQDAVRLSEEHEIEQAMFEDKLKTTDWEATNEAIEEQIARESYLQWCRDKYGGASSSTVTSTSINNNNDSNGILDVSISSDVILDQNLKILDSENTSNHSGSCSPRGRSCNDDNCDKKMAIDQCNNNNDTLLKSGDICASSSSIHKRRRCHNIGHHHPNSKLLSSSSSPENTCDASQMSECATHIAVLHKRRKRNNGPSTSNAGPSTSNNQLQREANYKCSSFYEALLAASYTPDGRMNEHEMLQQALQLSRIEFIKKNSPSSIQQQQQQGNHSCGSSKARTYHTAADDEYDSSP